VEDLVVAALDNMNGVDLHVTEVLHRQASRLRTVTEGRGSVEPLGMQPEASRVRLGQG
jgi:hypothetical protein